MSARVNHIREERRDSVAFLLDELNLLVGWIEDLSDDDLVALEGILKRAKRAYFMVEIRDKEEELSDLYRKAGIPR